MSVLRSLAVGLVVIAVVIVSYEYFIADYLGYPTISDYFEATGEDRETIISIDGMLTQPEGDNVYQWTYDDLPVGTNMMILNPTDKYTQNFVVSMTISAPVNQDYSWDLQVWAVGTALPGGEEDNIPPRLSEVFEIDSSYINDITRDVYLQFSYLDDYFTTQNAPITDVTVIDYRLELSLYNSLDIIVAQDIRYMGLVFDING